MFPTVRFLDKETGFDTSDMRRKRLVRLARVKQTGRFRLITHTENIMLNPEKRT